MHLWWWQVYLTKLDDGDCNIRGWQNCIQVQKIKDQR